MVRLWLYLRSSKKVQQMKPTNGYWVVMVLMAVDVVAGGAICDLFSISPGTSYFCGFASVFVLLILLIFIDELTDKIRTRVLRKNERD